jgi:hypothetical protein
MTHSRKLQLAALLLVIAFAIPVGLLIGSCSSPFSRPDSSYDTRVSSGITHFSALSTTNLTVTDDATITDDLTVTDDATVSGDLTVAGTTTLQAIVSLSAANLTVTTATITPTVSAYHADSSGAVTWTLPACSVNGQLLIIYGDDNNTITIADSNLRSTDGNAVTIGQYDVVLFICFDTEWNHVAKSANS